MKVDFKREIAVGQEGMKSAQEKLEANLTSQVKKLLDGKLSSVKNKIDLREVNDSEIEKDLEQEITDIKEEDTSVKEIFLL